MESTSTMVFLDTPDWHWFKGTPFGYDSSGPVLSSGCFVMATTAPVGSRPRGVRGFAPLAPIALDQYLGFIGIVGRQRNAFPDLEFTLDDLANPAREMHPAHRSLSAKVREEMSEFERQYSW